MEGKLVIITAPSGAGKTTLVKHLMEQGLSLSFSVSATTRPLRGNEKNGIDYYFLSVGEFRKKIKNDEFIEWEEVYNDLLYGTLKIELERIWAKNNHVLFDVDVKGAINLKKKFKTRSLSIFIMPPSIEELEHRLIRRATDTYDKIKMRTEKATEELKLADKFDIVIVNEDLNKAMKEIVSTVSTFLEN